MRIRVQRRPRLAPRLSGGEPIQMTPQPHRPARRERAAPSPNLAHGSLVLCPQIAILSVYLRRQDMKGRQSFVATVDRYVITFYPLAYIVTIATVALLFR